MTLTSVVVAGLVLAFGIMIGFLKEGIKADVNVVLLAVLVRGVRWSAKLIIPRSRQESYIAWFEDELLTMQELGGSGVGVALLFLCITGPYFAVRSRRVRTKR